jgi:hypothetical protein
MYYDNLVQLCVHESFAYKPTMKFMTISTTIHNDYIQDQHKNKVSNEWTNKAQHEQQTH